MRRSWIPCLFSLFSLPIFGFATTARAQDTDNEAISAAKNASLVLSVEGIVPVKPTRFYMTVNLFADGKDRAAVQANYEHSLAIVRSALEGAGFRLENVGESTLLRHVGADSFQVVNGAEGPDAPDALFRVAGKFSFPVSSGAKAQQAFAAMRATGASGSVILGYGALDEEAARRAALKSAIAQAKQRVEVLGEAAKPKQFDLVYLKEGTFQIDAINTGAKLQGSDTLTVADSIDAKAEVTLFYGFRPVTVAAAPKAVVKPPKKS